MSLVVVIPLLLSLAAGLVYILAKGARKWSSRIFLAGLTVFTAAAMSVGQPHESFRESAVEAFALDQAELSLRMVTAFCAVQERISKIDEKHSFDKVKLHNTPMSSVLVNHVYRQVVSALKQRSQMAPASQQALAEIMIVSGESGDESLQSEFHQAAHQLLTHGEPQQKELCQALITIYTKKSFSLSEAEQFKKLLDNSLPVGWYHNQVLLRILAQSKQEDAFTRLKAVADNQAIAFAQRAITLLTIMGTDALTGIITIVIFLATQTNAARMVPATALKPDTTDTPWSLTTAYGVLIGWVATQFLAQSVLMAGSHEHEQVRHVLQSGSVAAAATTAVVYLITTAPALLYIWWFACRPFKLPFKEAIKFRLKTSYAGFPKLVIAGVLTWCAAIPVVLGCQLLTVKLLDSQGSNNPVLTLVRDAAHSPNLLPIGIYFFILGVLAPFIEETLFRGFVYSSLRTRLGKFTSAGVSAALFAAAHFDLGASISLFALGFIFALVFERSQSTIPSMIAHGMWNCGTFSLVLMLFGGD